MTKQFLQKPPFPAELSLIIIASGRVKPNSNRVKQISDQISLSSTINTLNFRCHLHRSGVLKSSIRTRRSNGSVENTTFDGILKCLSNTTTAKNVCKKVGTNIVQLLLAHAFKAYLSLSFDQPAEGLPDAPVNVKDISLPEVCKLIISAITSIRELDKDVKLVRMSEEALFTAAAIVSTNK